MDIDVIHGGALARYFPLSPAGTSLFEELLRCLYSFAISLVLVPYLQKLKELLYLLTAVGAGVRGARDAQKFTSS
ncbi:MAG: hypothetical protein WA639_05010 [Candidatus Acidiferrum sp.]